MTEETSNQVQPKDDIDLIPGHTKILLIAPHGVASKPYDDENTAKLTQKIADILKCHSIINRTYRKPKGPPGESEEHQKKRNGGEPEGVLDLNKFKQAKLHPTFLKEIKEIVNAKGLTYVFWIHGAKDASIEGDISDKAGVNPKDVKVLVGYGQKANDDRFTARPETVDKVIQGLNANGLNTVLGNPEKVADEDAGIFTYCGRDRSRMNQWFQPKYKFKQVQSIQLEFRWTGCRDNEENIKSTAESIARAISALAPPVEKVTEPADKKEQPADQALVTEKTTDPEEIKGTIEDQTPAISQPVGENTSTKVGTEPTTEEEIPEQETTRTHKMTDEDDREDAIEVGEATSAPEDKNPVVKAGAQKKDKDDPLVEEAYSYLFKVFSKHYANAMMEAGRYIIKTFYGNDIHNAKANKPTNKETLNQLYDKIKENSNPDNPSKSKLYHAKNLVVQEHDLGKYLSKESFSTFRNLSLSHKIYLLSVRNIFKKKARIEQVAFKKLSVRDLQDALKGSQSDDPTPLHLINNPNKIWEDENSNFFNYDNLINHSHKELKKYQETLASKKATYEKYLKKFMDIEDDLKKAIETNKGKPEKLFGFQEWIKHSVNISKGCSNDCKYCFAKSAAYRREQVENGQWSKQIIRKKDVDKKYKQYDGLVGFPTSHDITPSNVDEYIKVLKKLLNFGNEILIVSKPNFDCIKKICEIASNHKKKILFRFSIGSMDDDILSFWDTNAPKYEERKKSLEYAFKNEFQTSVSMEPLLDSANVVSTVSDLVEFVTDSIWIGKMNYTEELWDEALKNDDENLLKRLEAIESGQTDDKIKSVYAEFQKYPDLLEKIKWKDSYREVLGVENAE